MKSYGFAAAMAAAIACSCASVREARKPIPPRLALIARLKSAASRFEADMLRIALIAPWHDEQFAE